MDFLTSLVRLYAMIICVSGCYDLFCKRGCFDLFCVLQYIILYNHFYGDVVLTSLVRVHVLTFCVRGDVKTFFKEMFFPFC